MIIIYVYDLQGKIDECSVLREQCNERVVILIKDESTRSKRSIIGTCVQACLTLIYIVLLFIPIDFKMGFISVLIYSTLVFIVSLTVLRRTGSFYFVIFYFLVLIIKPITYAMQNGSIWLFFNSLLFTFLGLLPLGIASLCIENEKWRGKK